LVLWYSKNIYVKVLDTAVGEGRIHTAPFFFHNPNDDNDDNDDSGDNNDANGDNDSNNFFIAVQGSENIEGEGEECPDISLAGRQNATNTIIFLDLDNPNALGWRYANVGVNTIGMKRIVGFLFEDIFYFGEGYGFECADDIMSSAIYNPYLFFLNPNKIINQ